MAIAPGTRLGSYEIVALIGAGGMGEVYRARDARLERDVAIKVLPGAAGVLAIAPPVVAADGRVFAYRYQQILSDLFVTTGLK
jgi:hypothetical protein